MIKVNRFARFPLFAIVSMLFLVYAARADQASDQARISAVHDNAELLYLQECPNGQEPPCSGHDLPIHKSRLQKYGEEERLLIVYLNRWSGNPHWSDCPPSGALDPPLAKQITLLGRAAYRAEDLGSAVKYFSIVRDAHLSGANDLTIKERDHTYTLTEYAVGDLNDICKTGFAVCSIGVSGGTTGLGGAIGVVGKAADIAGNDVTNLHGVQKPPMLDHITVGQLQQIQNDFRVMAGIGP